MFTLHVFLQKRIYLWSRAGGAIFGAREDHSKEASKRTCCARTPGMEMKCGAADLSSPPRSPSSGPSNVTVTPLPSPQPKHVAAPSFVTEAALLLPQRVTMVPSRVTCPFGNPSTSSNASVLPHKAGTTLKLLIGAGQGLVPPGSMGEQALERAL